MIRVVIEKTYEKELTIFLIVPFYF